MTEDAPPYDADKPSRSFVVYLVEDEHQHWLASDSFSDAYGYGKDPTHALFSWLRDVDSRYRDFTKHERKNRLGKGLMQELAKMRKVLAR